MAAAVPPAALPCLLLPYRQRSRRTARTGRGRGRPAAAHAAGDLDRCCGGDRRRSRPSDVVAHRGRYRGSAAQTRDALRQRCTPRDTPHRRRGHAVGAEAGSNALDPAPLCPEAGAVSDTHAVRTRRTARRRRQGGTHTPVPATRRTWRAGSSDTRPVGGDGATATPCWNTARRPTSTRSPRSAQRTKCPCTVHSTGNQSWGVW